MSVSVIIPVLIREQEQVDMTMKCITLADTYTDVPFELTIVETESDYFMEEPDIYIYEAQRTTATRSINRALRTAVGDYVVLLTNDVFVNEGWLECLLECFAKKEDCGLATLASTQFDHYKQDLIEEGIWFSVAMMKRRDVYFDEGYVNSWDDTDLIMRTYLDGYKMYRNHNCVVDHLIGATHYQDHKHQENFENNRKRFIKKYKEHKDTEIYKILTEGIVV